MKHSSDVPQEYVIEVYMIDTEAIHIDILDIVSPTVIRVGIGHRTNIKFSAKIMEGVKESVGESPISAVLLPENIPTSAVELFFPLMNYGNIIYMKDGETGLDIKAYTMKPGYLPDEIDYRKKKSVDTPVDVTDGFHPIDSSDDPFTTGGFHDISKYQDVISDDVIDGNSDVTVERREMWTEDPVRMNRLSYMPIATIRGDQEFPAELGGGETGITPCE